MCRILSRGYLFSLYLVYETHVQFAHVETFWKKQNYFLVFIEEASGHLLTGKMSPLHSYGDYAPIYFLYHSKAEHEWCCSSNYASPTLTLRPILWDHLRHLSNNILVHWLLMRDFNDIVQSTEVLGGYFHRLRA